MKKQILLFLILISLNLFAQESTSWTGIASYYHSKFNGRKTTSGEIFNNSKLTAASNKIALGTKVRVINLSNNKSVEVIINDRMHPRNKRLIDLSTEAAKQLGFYGKGLCKVRIELVSIPNTKHDSTDTIVKHKVHSQKRVKKKSH